MALPTDDRRPMYLVIADDIRSKIANGDYAEGAKLPATPELAETYGVAKMTVQNAITELRKAGILSAQQGRGTYVRADARALATAEPREPVEGRVSAVEQELASLAARVAALERRLDTR